MFRTALIREDPTTRSDSSLLECIFLETASLDMSEILPVLHLAVCDWQKENGTWIIVSIKRNRTGFTNFCATMGPVVRLLQQRDTASLGITVLWSPFIFAFPCHRLRFSQQRSLYVDTIPADGIEPQIHRSSPSGLTPIHEKRVQRHTCQDRTRARRRKFPCSANPQQSRNASLNWMTSTMSLAILAVCQWDQHKAGAMQKQFRNLDFDHGVVKISSHPLMFVLGTSLLMHRSSVTIRSAMKINSHSPEYSNPPTTCHSNCSLSSSSASTDATCELSHIFGIQCLHWRYRVNEMI
jgi:hypothetical protein